jgi:hypothetical protein
MDHFRWPNKFFRENGLFSLVEAHQKLLQSSLRQNHRLESRMRYVNAALMLRRNCITP